MERSRTKRQAFYVHIILKQYNLLLSAPSKPIDFWFKRSRVRIALWLGLRHRKSHLQSVHVPSSFMYFLLLLLFAIAAAAVVYPADMKVTRCLRSVRTVSRVTQQVKDGSL